MEGETATPAASALSVLPAEDDGARQTEAESSVVAIIPVDKEVEVQAVAALAPKRDILDIIRELESTDSRIGWAPSRPDYSKVVHGWFFSSHVNVLTILLDKEKTECVIELGSWLGRSAEYFARNAPNAVIFAVDIWDNSVILQDKHYCMNPENLAILNVGPLHERFMSNMWEYKYQISKDGTVRGMLPLRMDAVAGLRLLKEAGVVPDVVYVDANHHFEGVYRDISATIELFPNAHIVGDDYDYPDVRRAVLLCAKEHNLGIYESGNKCWTYSKDFCRRELKKRKHDEEETEKQPAAKPQRAKLGGNESLKDLLKMYKKRT
jgi:hypothetical protein